MGLLVTIVLLGAVLAFVIWYCGVAFTDEDDAAAIAKYQAEKRAFEDLFE